MDWWQIALIILAAVVAGLLIGGLISYLITRILNRSPVEKQEPVAVTGEQSPNAKAAPIRQFFKKTFGKKIETPEVTAQLQSSYPPEPPVTKTPPKKAETSEDVVEEPTLTIPGLVEEIKSNQRIANDTLPATGNLTPFETSIWDASRNGSHAIPANLRDDLAQAYVDMRLANSIVWLSVELGRRSPNLDESYSKLCTNIAARLNRIAPQFKHN